MNGSHHQLSYNVTVSCGHECTVSKAGGQHTHTFDGIHCWVGGGGCAHTCHLECNSIMNIHTLKKDPDCHPSFNSAAAEFSVLLWTQNVYTKAQN